MGTNYPRGALIEEFDIHCPGPTGGRLRGKLYGGPRGGLSRHLRVFEGTRIIFDEDSVDCGNATNRLDWWLAEQPWVPIPAPLLAQFAEPDYLPSLKADGTADSIDAAYWLRWNAERAALSEAPPRACDHCGSPADGGQSTAEDVICGRCVAKAKAGEPFAKRRLATDILTGRGPIGFDLGGES